MHGLTYMFAEVLLIKSLLGLVCATFPSFLFYLATLVPKSGKLRGNMLLALQIAQSLYRLGGCDARLFLFDSLY